MKLAVLADSHLTGRTDTPQWAAFNWALSVFRAESVDCALLAGDITACGDMDSAMLARDALDGCDTAWVAVPGNSDLRSPDMAEATARLFAPPFGGVSVGGVRALGIDTSRGGISPFERRRMNIQDHSSKLILFSHHPAARLDADSRAFIENWIRSRESAGQSVLYWFSGHELLGGRG